MIFQPLIDVEGIGPVDIAERLIGEQALGDQERPALALTLLNTTVRFWRSRVGSPFASRKCAE